MRLPHAKVIALERNIGLAAANNIAIRASTAPPLLFPNSDAQLRGGALDTLIERLDATAQCRGRAALVDHAGRPEVSFG